MWGVMKRNEAGFTLIEIIVVLMLLSIIAATVLGRGMNTERIDLAAQMDKIRNHFRYAQTMAMKYGNKVWGIRCANDNPREYYMFNLSVPVSDLVNDPDDSANQVTFPGETDLRINLDEQGVSMDHFTIFFDRFGRPYDSAYVLLAAVKDIKVTAGTHEIYLHITPETGLIQ